MEQPSPCPTAPELAHHDYGKPGTQRLCSMPEKPARHKGGQPPLATTGESPCSKQDPAQPKINKEVIFKGLNILKYKEGETN